MIWLMVLTERSKPTYVKAVPPCNKGEIRFWRFVLGWGSSTTTTPTKGEEAQDQLETSLRQNLLGYHIEDIIIVLKKLTTEKNYDLLRYLNQR